MVILAVIAMIVGKYDNICAILLGIVFLVFTYRDKNKPSPGLTAAYSFAYSWLCCWYYCNCLRIAQIF